MSPFHTTKWRICSLLLSSSLVGSSRHLEYLDDGVFLLPSGHSRGHLVCREMLPVQNDGDVWLLSEALPAGACLRNTLLWPSILFSDGRESRASSFNRLSWWRSVTTTVASSNLRRGTGDGTHSLFCYDKVPDDPVNEPRLWLTPAEYPCSSGISNPLHQRIVPCSRMSSTEGVIITLLSLFHLLDILQHRGTGLCPAGATPLWALRWVGARRDE